MKKHIQKNLFLLIFIPLLLISCKEVTTTDVQETATISGVVIDEQQIPVPLAYLEAINADNSVVSKDTSDEDGNYQLKNIPSDLSDVMVRIVHQDFKLFEVKANKIAENNYQAAMRHDDSCCGKLYFIIRKASDSSIIDNAEVRLNRHNNIIRKTRSNSNGMVVFENVCPGNYWVRIAKDGYTVIEYEFNLPHCDTLEYTFYMQSNGQDTCCHGVMKVFPKDSATNEPLNGATVKLWKNGQVSQTTYVHEGQAGFDGLCPGTYAISILKENYKTVEFSFTIECNQKLEETKYLAQKSTSDSCCNGALKIVPKNAGGESLNGATVKLWKNGTLLSTNTVADGKALFTKLCKGTYGVDIIMEGYKAIEFSVTLDCNEEKVVTKVLERNSIDTCCTAKLKLKILDSLANTVISGARVLIYNESGQIVADPISNAEGWAGRENLCAPMTYRVTISKDGYTSKTFHFRFEECKTISETIRLVAQ